MSKNITRAFRNHKGELLTLPWLNGNQKSCLVSTRNLEIPENEVYIMSTELPASMVCTDMLLPWTAKNLSDAMLKMFVAKITSLISIINDQRFPYLWEKIHGVKIDNNTKIKVMITEKEALIEPQVCNNKDQGASSKIDKHAVLEAKNIFLQTEFGKQIMRSLRRHNSLRADVLNNMINIAKQEMLLSKQEIVKIQLGK